MRIIALWHWRRDCGDCVEQAFDCLDAPIVRLTAPDVPAIPFSAPLEKFTCRPWTKLSSGDQVVELLIDEAILLIIAFPGALPSEGVCSLTLRWALE